MSIKKIIGKESELLGGDTKLYLPLDNSIEDNSGHNHSLSVNGNTNLVSKKFGTASAYFDGVGDYLSIPAVADFDITSGDLTIDFWVKFSNATAIATEQLYDISDGTNDNRLYLQRTSTGVVRFGLLASSSSVFSVDTTIFSSSEWTHIAIIKSGNNYGLYINGVQRSYATSSATASFGDDLRIGAHADSEGNFLNASIDEYRIQSNNSFSATPVVGLTDTITVPTAEHAVDADTKLLMHFNDSFKDESPADHSVTEVGTPKLSDAVFGSSAFSFNGTNQNLSIPASSDFDICGSISTDYTIDGWFKFNDTAHNAWFTQFADSNNYMSVYYSAGTLAGLLRSGGSNTMYTSAPVTLNLEQWYHISFVKVGTDYAIYVDGVQKTFINSSATHNFSATQLDIGKYNANYFNGSMDEIRVQNSNSFSATPVVGLTDTITVPTGEHTADTNTKLLLHANGTFKDDSGKDHTVTSNGDTHVSSTKFGTNALSFNGVDQYLSIPDSDDWELLDNLTGEQTIDFWVKIGSPISGQHIFMNHYSSGSAHWHLSSNSGSHTVQFYTSAGPLHLNTTTDIYDSEWHHIALVKTGSSMGLYVDGVQEAFGTVSTTLNIAGNLFVGTYGDLSQRIKGYMDEVRIQQSNSFSATPVVGLTDTITVPTAEHTADENTKLLLHANGTFEDDSGKDHSVTANGDLHLSSAKFGNAIMFDGSTQYLTTPNHTDLFPVAYEDFSVECWVKFDTLGTTAFIWNHWGLPQTYLKGRKLVKNSSNQLQYIYSVNGSNQFTITTSYVFADTNWHHVALHRNNTVARVYVDGTYVGGANNFEGTPAIGRGFVLGADGQGGNKLPGAMDEFRYMKGSGSAPWTSQVTPYDVPTNPYTSDANTKMLLHLDGDVVDSGNTVHTITSVGSPSYTSKKFGNASASFDGDGDYLEVADSDEFNIVGNNTDTYTVDCWIKDLDYDRNGGNYILQQEQDSLNRWIFSSQGNSSGAGTGIFFNYVIAGTWYSMNFSGEVISDSDWHHVAVVIKGNGVSKDIGMYVDGVQVAFSNSSANVNYSAPVRIGMSGSTSQCWYGNIDELRITQSNPFNASPNVGETDTITVPTTIHTTDTNTKLLMHFDNDLNDSSNIGHTVTAQNDADFSQSKFGTGSAKFDGTGDYLTVPDSTNWDFFADTVSENTIDFWVRCNETGVGEYFFGQGNANYTRHSLYRNGDGTYSFSFASNGSSWNLILNGTTVYDDTNWHHVALIIKNNEAGLYVDGVQEAYGTFTAGNISGDLWIGSREYASNSCNAFIDEFRVQNSNAFSATPVVGLTDTITVPTVEHSVDADTKLLMHFNDNLEDSSNIGHTVTAINNTDFTQRVFGKGSVLFNGSTDYLSIADSDDWNFGTGDYAVDAWVKFSSFPQANNAILNTYNVGFYMDYNTGTGLRMIEYPGTDVMTRAWAPAVDTWYHVAYSRSSGVCRLFVDGTQLGTTETRSIDISSGHALWIGNADGFAGYLDGYMDEVRISKGTDRGWTSNFTVPTTEYTPDANTMLLMHFNDNLLDSSDRGHNITKNGDVTLAPKINNACVHFNGSTDFISIPDSSDWDMMGDTINDYTIDFWAKILNVGTAVDSYQVQHITDNSNRWQIYTYEGEIRFSYRVGGAWVVSHSGYGANVVDKKWHHIALVKKANVVALYLDGVQISHSTFSTTASYSSNLLIGASQQGGIGLESSFHQGYIDELRLNKSNSFSANPVVGLTDTIDVTDRVLVDEIETISGISKANIGKISGQSI